jgi:hypothetical protein
MNSVYFSYSSSFVLLSCFSISGIWALVKWNHLPSNLKVWFCLMVRYQKSQICHRWRWGSAKQDAVKSFIDSCA